MTVTNIAASRIRARHGQRFLDVFEAFVAVELRRQATARVDSASRVGVGVGVGGGGEQLANHARHSEEFLCIDTLQIGGWNDRAESLGS
jgi:hypothetical protein